jgi:hypothetical protein
MNEFNNNPQKRKKFDTIRKKISNNNTNRNHSSMNSIKSALHLSFYDPANEHLFSPYLDNFSSGIINEKLAQRCQNRNITIISRNPAVLFARKGWIWSYNSPMLGKKTFKIPDHLVNDFFNLYFTESYKLKVDPKVNIYKFKIVKYLNDANIKILTNNHYINSFYFTESAILFVVAMLNKLQNQVDSVFEPGNTQPHLRSLKKLVNDSNFLHSYTTDKNFKKLIDSSLYNRMLGENEQDLEKLNDAQKKMYEKYQEEINKILQKIDAFKDDDAQPEDGNTPSNGDSTKELNEFAKGIKKILQDEAFDKSSQMSEFEKSLDSFNESNNAGNEIGSIYEIDSYETIMSQLKMISISNSTIDTLLAKILKNALSYFKFNDKFVSEPMIDSENIDSINEIELLTNEYSLFDLNIEDITTKRRLKDGKFSLYIDISGSMSSSTGGKSNLNRLIVAKALALKLYKMKIVDKIYFSLILE